MKNGIYFILVMGILILSCKSKCLDHNRKNIKVRILSNYENVSDHFANETLWIHSLEKPLNHQVNGFQLNYAEVNNEFRGEVDELCPNDESLSYLIEFIRNDNIPVLDTLDFEVSKNGGREKCKDCKIDNIMSRKGGEVEIKDDWIEIKINI